MAKMSNPKMARPMRNDQGELTLSLWVLFVFFYELSNTLVTFLKLPLIIILWHPTRKLGMTQVLCHPQKWQDQTRKVS